MGFSISGFLRPFVKQAADAAERLGTRGIEAGVNKLESMATSRLPQAGNFVKGKVDGLTDRLADSAESASDRFISKAVDRAAQFRFLGGLINSNRDRITSALDNAFDPHKYEGKLDVLANRGIDRLEGRAADLIQRAGDKVESFGDKKFIQFTDRAELWANTKVDRVDELASAKAEELKQKAAAFAARKANELKARAGGFMADKFN